MDIKTASAILLAQVGQLNNMVTAMNTTAAGIDTIANQENPDADIALRIKALVATIDVQITATTSETVLVQNAADNLASILA